MRSPEAARRCVQLTVRINGSQRTELTEKGLLVQELVRIASSLTKNKKPSVSFAMSDSMVHEYSERRDELRRLLGLPKDEVAMGKIIKRYERKLRDNGHPHWHFK